MRYLTLLLLLVGCATTPPDYDIVAPTNYSEQDKKQHFYDCKLQARAVLPGTPVSGYYGGGFSGGLSEGYAIARSRPKVVYDPELVKECLEAKGYKFVYKD